jgi:tryptophan-rich sensory protein
LKGSARAWIAFGGAVAAAAIAGSLFNPAERETRDWYEDLEKPSFNPPDKVFAPVWTVLYALIAISGVRVWRAPASAARSQALALWSAQLVFNGAWSPLFVGAKKPAVAFADILLLLATIVGYTARSRRVDRAASWMFVPYLAWVAFATVLNGAIVMLNREER